MKKTILLLGWILAECPLMWGQIHYLEDVVLENRAIEKVGHNVKVSADIRLDGMKLNRQQALRLVPVLVSNDGMHQQELEPVLIEGKVRSKVNARKQALGEMTEDGNSVRIRRENRKSQTVNYHTETVFNSWMVNGRLELRAYVTGCAECNEGDEVLFAGEILPYRDPQFGLAAFMQPTEETVKRRNEVQTARLQYRQNSHNILPKYKNNRDELDKVQASINAVKENSDLTITGIYVTGYASPEGPVAYNLDLSKRRAQKFAQYVQKENPDLAQSLWHVDWIGEDWNGLRAVVEKYSNLLKQDEVLRIINECNGDQDACEEKIKALVPAEIYQRVQNEMYGPLRRNEYRIEYNVRHFDLQEARELLKSRPDLLSIAEIQKVADSYGRNTEQYRDALKVAVRTYPDNTVARYNAALAEVETGHYTEAITLLKDVEEGAMLNLLGIAYFKKEQFEESERAFRKAIEAGYAGAADNLRMEQEAEELLGK